MSQSRVITARFTQRPSVWIVECSGAANPDVLKMGVKGRRAGRYAIETSPGSQPLNWVSRGILETPYGRAQYLEPISKDWIQRIYRVVDVTEP
jgi:hypothetical protein